MEVIEMNDASREELFQKHTKAVLKFHASWCGMCRLIGPKFKKLAKNEDYAEVTFFDVNAEENPELRDLVKASNLPFFAYFENGNLVKGLATSKIESVEKLIKEGGAN